MTRAVTRRSSGSSPTATYGPSGHAPSNPFARVHWSSLRWMSRAVTSLPTVYPKTFPSAASGDTSRVTLPMTTASSASWWTSADQCGRTIGSSGPMTDVFGLRNSSGDVGTSLPISRTWSA